MHRLLAGEILEWKEIFNNLNPLFVHFKMRFSIVLKDTVGFMVQVNAAKLMEESGPFPNVKFPKEFVFPISAVPLTMLISKRLVIK